MKIQTGFTWTHFYGWAWKTADAHFGAAEMVAAEGRVGDSTDKWIAGGCGRVVWPEVGN